MEVNYLLYLSEMITFIAVEVGALEPHGRDAAYTKICILCS